MAAGDTCVSRRGAAEVIGGLCVGLPDVAAFAAGAELFCRLVGIEFGARVEAQPPKFEIQPAPRQAEQACGFRNVASRPIQGRLNHVSLDLFDGRGKAGAASGKRRPIGRSQAAGKFGASYIRRQL